MGKYDNANILRLLQLKKEKKPKIKGIMEMIHQTSLLDELKSNQ
jgi:hypothetical protein